MTKTWFASTHASAAALAPARITAGLVFIASALVKLLYENQGAGRFAKIGLPAPGALVTFVSAVELLAGALLVAGLFTRPAALALAVDMIVAIVTTKLPLLLGAGPEPLGAAPKTGFFAFAYQARLDVMLLALCATLFLAGAGEVSLDSWRAARARAAPSPG
jgi:uncharacterized membrane protein YphA (DoxX/SURF4 family)